MFFLYIHLNRLTPPKLDPIYDETIAGRRFLEALRQNHGTETNDTVAAVPPNVLPNVRTASSFNFGVTPKADGDVDDANDLQRKRMNLRASLEELLVEYLNLRTTSSVADDETSDDTANDGNRSRVKRASSESFPQSAAIHARLPQKRNVNDNDAKIRINIGNGEHRLPISQTGEIPNESIELDNDDYGNSTAATNATAKNVCEQRRQRITQLDRNELATAIHSGSEHEHNIRGLLNYRYVLHCMVLSKCKEKKYPRKYGFRFIKLPKRVHVVNLWHKRLLTRRI